ncbi:MAG: hypothetical protein RJA44_107 [Pseudomonadota bacterium]
MIPDADALLGLLNEARAADGVATRRFVLLNRTREVVPYHAAVLWQEDEGLCGHSGVGSIDLQGPYAQWLSRMVPALWAHAPGPLEASDAGPPAAEAWPQWWPPHLLWLPLAPTGAPRRALLLVRDIAWSPAELAGLGEWFSLWSLLEQARGDARPRRFIDVGALWQSMRQGGSAQRSPRQRLLRLAPLGLLLLALLPVQMTLRAPGELVPREPTVLRSTLDGSVRRLLVEPNQSVQAGQVLAELDDASVSSRLQAARQALVTAEAEWRQTSQLALGDARAKAQLPAALGRLEERQTEVRYLEQQAQRTTLLASHAGVVLIDDPGSWAGRSVQAGEAILRLAEPQDQELEAWLAVGDAIDLPPGSAMQLHLSSRPASPVGAELRLYAFEAEHRPDGTLAYRLRGRLTDAARERLGARGTAHIAGPRVPLIYWMLRRPLAALREATGW